MPILERVARPNREEREREFSDFKERKREREKKGGRRTKEVQSISKEFKLGL